MHVLLTGHRGFIGRHLERELVERGHTVTGVELAYPFLYAVYLSFHQAVGIRIGNFVGLYNYISLWEDAIFREAVWLTIRFTVFSVFIKFWICLAAALMLRAEPEMEDRPEHLRRLAWLFVAFGILCTATICLHTFTAQPPYAPGVRDGSFWDNAWLAR